MPKRFYEPKAAGTELQLYIDPQAFVKTDDEAALVAVQELLALDTLSEGAKAELQLTDERFDLWRDQEDEILDRLDYYDYADRAENLTVRDGAWFTPDAVESSCGETGGNVETQSIDGDNGTWWRHAVDERHSIIYELRDHSKKVSKIRFRYGASESATERLTNLDVHAAKAVANIDEPESILETGIAITWPTGQGDVWVEHTLAAKKNKARFIKLVFDSDHAQNTMRIREFAVWVETRDP